MATGRVPTTANSPLTAKGDLFTYSTAPARLAVGNDGETIVADSAAATGLRWQPNGSAGKNSVINGDCVIAQRGSSALTLSGSAQYPVDRFWSTGHSGATAQQISSISNTSFKNAVRVQRTNGNSTTTDLAFIQTFETNASIPLQGKTVTLSFWARAGANYSPSSSGLVSRVYTGTGTDQGGYGFSWTGTANPINQTNTLTTSWQRFTATGTISSSATQIQVYFFCTPTGTAGAADYFDITGIQLEQGSVATAFQTATGTLQGELAACQRYYVRIGNTSTNATLSMGSSNSAGTVSIQSLALPVEMRVAPTVLDYANIRLSDGSTGYTITSATLISGTTTRGNISCATSGMTAFRLHLLDASATGNYVGFSAEL